MQVAAIPNSRIVEAPFEKALKTARRALRGAGLSVAAELAMSGAQARQFHSGAQAGTVLLVDSPLLLLESVALDRAAAVFVPYHIVICGDRESSYVCWPELGGAEAARLPATARRAMDSLWKRISMAMEQDSVRGK